MTETATATPAPDALASVVADASFVRLVATDDGDALAAAGLLARALRTVGTPFQVRVARDPVPDDEADAVTVTLGASTGEHAVPGTERPASTTAFAVARELGDDPDPVLALAGVVAAGSVPGTDGSGDALAAAERTERVRRRPGVAIPTADLADGLSASTLIRAPYSGDPEAARAALAALDLPMELDDDDHRRLASLVAVDVAAAESASERAAASVERALRPYATDDTAAAFETVGGYADVLDALAREQPGTGVALALTDEPSEPVRTAALDVWRTHGLAVHRALDVATTGRYDGCVVARVDAPESTLPTIARLVRDFRSPEPVAIAVDEAAGAIAAAATESVGLGAACRDVAVEFDGDGWGSAARGGVSVDGGTTDALAALRGAL
ncbi:exonuclease RecJ [Halorubrum sp. DTA98]|uniref:exonuclease RecJ n=1 Tax=Halorubrum sp. DTA98 TaxID=3402163 RepID=UPI003AAB9602